MRWRNPIPVRSIYEPTDPSKPETAPKELMMSRVREVTLRLMGIHSKAKRGGDRIESDKELCKGMTIVVTHSDGRAVTYLATAQGSLLLFPVLQGEVGPDDKIVAYLEPLDVPGMTADNLYDA